MCRLAYIPRPIGGMAKWLLAMERSAGGDGMGITVGKGCVKGTRVRVTEAVAYHWDAQIIGHRRGKVLTRKRPLPALWHTRRTSSGGDCDDLCHPFECDGGWLAHNGHWHWAHQEAQKLHKKARPMSDSRLFSQLVDRAGFEEIVRDLEPPGVWLHMSYGGKLRAYRGSGDLVYCESGPAAGAWASEPSSSGKWIEVPLGYHGTGKPEIGALEQQSWWSEPTVLYRNRRQADRADAPEIDEEKDGGWWR